MQVPPGRSITRIRTRCIFKWWRIEDPLIYFLYWLTPVTSYKMQIGLVGIKGRAKAYSWEEKICNWIIELNSPVTEEIISGSLIRLPKWGIFRLGQDGRFSERHFQLNFLEWKCFVVCFQFHWNLFLRILLLKYTLVQAMAKPLTRDKPLNEQMMTTF